MLAGFRSRSRRIMNVEARLLNVLILVIFIQSSLDGCRIHNLLRQKVLIVDDSRRHVVG